MVFKAELMVKRVIEVFDDHKSFLIEPGDVYVAGTDRYHAMRPFMVKRISGTTYWFDPKEVGALLPKS